MADQILTAARLREVLHYDPLTGIFTRLVRLAQRHQVGSRADFMVTAGNLTGYYRVSIDSRRYLAHRVAWFYMTGEWPRGVIDHRDGDKSNTRFDNLRDVSHRINQENIRKPKSDNLSGFLGVISHKDGKHFYARLQVNYRIIRLGSFPTPQQAHAAYLIGKRKYHEGCTL